MAARIIEERLKKLEDLTLLRGAHNPPSNGDVECCWAEAAAWVAGEEWSDHPGCVSPVIAAFGRSWNDALDDDTRQRLKPYVVKAIGTRAGPKIEEARAWMSLDWLARAQLLAWLKLAKLDDHVRAIEGLQVIHDAQSAERAIPVLAAARAAAGAAAWDAAGAAAWDAAGAAAGAAARDAAWDAARAAAGAAAWDAAWAAARAAAGAAARDAARDAAWDAAGAALRPTIVELQDSAFDLLDRMIAEGEAA